MDLVDPFHDCGTECDVDGRNAVGRDGGGGAVVGVELAAAAVAAGTCIETKYLSWALRYSHELTFLSIKINHNRITYKIKQSNANCHVLIDSNTIKGSTILGMNRHNLNLKYNN